MKSYEIVRKKFIIYRPEHMIIVYLPRNQVIYVGKNYHIVKRALSIKLQSYQTSQ